MISRRFFEEVFVTEIYKPGRKLGSMNIIIDLGACTGEFSLWVYSQAQKIYAIEADIEAFNHLHENIKDFPRIIPIHVAIAGKNGIRSISGTIIGAKSIINIDDDSLPKVRAKTLATFLEEEKIAIVDCLKIDIESAEKEVFEAEDFPMIADKIKYIIGEPHSYYKAIKKALSQNGFKVNEYPHGYIARRK